MTLAMDTLTALQQRFATAAVSPPKEQDYVMYWAGTALAIAGIPLLVGEGELDEIIETPAVTPIPGTRPWVMGLATHRGGLIPVMSGDALLRAEPYTGRVRDYCMVVRRPGVHFALTLSEVRRSMKFPLDERDMNREADPAVAGFTLGGFSHGKEFLAVLDLDKLVKEGELADAAIAVAESDEDLGDG